MAYSAQSHVANGDFYPADDRNQQIDNTVQLEAFCGESYDTSGSDHDHDDTDSKAVSIVAAGAVGQSELNTATSETSRTTAGETEVAITTEYAFLPLVKFENASVAYNTYFQWDDMNDHQSTSYFDQVEGTYTQTIALGVEDNDATAQDAYMKYRYVTSSPPHPLGTIPDWGCFVTLLRLANGDIASINIQDDPAWSSDTVRVPHGDGGMWRPPKNHPARLAYVPSAIRDSTHDGEPVETVLVDLRAMNEVIDVELPSERMLAIFLSDALRWTDQAQEWMQAQEAELRAAIDTERQRMREARVLLNSWDEIVTERLERVRWDRKWDSDPERQTALLRRIPLIMQRKKRHLQRVARRMTKLDVVREELDVRGATMAGLLMGKTKPRSVLQRQMHGLVQATHELRTLDRSRLPAIVCPRHGKPWTDVVKVLRRPSMT